MKRGAGKPQRQALNRCECAAASDERESANRGTEVDGQYFSRLVWVRRACASSI
jgi:hypothetical protein